MSHIYSHACLSSGHTGKREQNVKRPSLTSPAITWQITIR